VKKWGQVGFQRRPKSNLTPFIFLVVAGAAHALDTPQWPPPAADAARMRELQQVIMSGDSTREQRDAARAELGRMMMGPATSGPLPHTRPRAAIDPFPPIESPVVKLPAPRADPPDVARLEVVSPSRVIVNPATGGTIAPLGSTVIDTRTGTILQETPSGYLDPRTGRLIPK
jgi:hypothetical protein